MYNQPVDPKVKEDITRSLNAVRDMFSRITSKVTNNIVSESRNDSELHEALQTQEIRRNVMTENGVKTPVTAVQKGNFAVFPMPTSSGKNRYDVVNMTTEQKLVSNLHLAESANSIVKLLNKGHSFYSPQIKVLLEFEEKYTKHYNDCITFKRKIKNNPTKDTIMESRFNESKNQAIMIKEQLSDYIRKVC